MEEKKKKKSKKLKKDEVGDNGESRGEIECGKILEKEGDCVKERQGNAMTKQKKRKSNLESKNMDKEHEVGVKDVDSSVKVGEAEGDAAGREENVKVKECKKKIGNVEGGKVRKDEEVGGMGGSKHVEVDRNIFVEKTERKKKNKKDRKKGGSGHKLTEHNVGDVSLASVHGTQKVEIVKTREELDGAKKAGKKKKKKKDEEEGNKKCGTGEELDGGLAKKAERKKKKKKDKEVYNKHGGSGQQFIEQSLEDVSRASCHSTQNGELVNTEEGLDGGFVQKVGKNKRKREKKKDEVEVNIGSSPQDTNDLPNNAKEKAENSSLRELETDGACDKDVTKKSRKKQRFRDHQGKGINASDSDQVNANSTGNEKIGGGKRKKTKSVEHNCQNDKPGKNKKKVKFADHVEVFPLADHGTSDSGRHHEELVRGKRFSPEEDEIVKKAVYDYIEAHCLGEDGLNMVLNCRTHPEVRSCWKEIALAIPYRPRDAVYHRAQNLFRRSKTAKWTEEEYEMVREFQKEHGNQWKLLAEELQKHRVHVKDTWRRIRYSNLKKGHWSQEEYQALFDLVNVDLRMRYNEEKKSKHGMLRDNVCWTAVSDKLSTRSDALCCQKWYDQLTSSMVAEGEWADADDYRLINALYELDASCVEDVDWDSLLEHRAGDVCHKRWNQMVLHIGYHRTRSFAEQVEVLAKRYCPDLLEFREAWDSKPVVP